VHNGVIKAQNIFKKYIYAQSIMVGISVVRVFSPYHLHIIEAVVINEQCLDETAILQPQCFPPLGLTTWTILWMVFPESNTGVCFSYRLNFSDSGSKQKIKVVVRQHLSACYISYSTVGGACEPHGKGHYTVIMPCSANRAAAGQQQLAWAAVINWP